MLDYKSGWPCHVTHTRINTQTLLPVYENDYVGDYGSTAWLGGRSDLNIDRMEMDTAALLNL